MIFNDFLFLSSNAMMNGWFDFSTTNSIQRFIFLSIAASQRL